MLTLAITPAEYAEVVRERLVRLGCSAAYVASACAEVLAHTERGPAHPQGTLWLKPGEQPSADHYTETSKNRESHGYI